MLSVLLAFSLDYSLFMLSRYVENRQRGLDREENAEVMLFETGHTILVSGILQRDCETTQRESFFLDVRRQVNDI